MSVSRASVAGAGDGTGSASPATRSPWLMLALATLGFALNFWAWALLSPLGPLFRTEGTLGTLSESDVALLVAVPVLVGSLGRIPVGALTDRFGGRVMFPLVSAATIIPILFIGYVGLRSFGALLLGGFFLGIGGTAFAVGVPFVNAWFPPERRGLAIGIFGAGMGGTAISALTTVKLYSKVGHQTPFLLTALALTLYAVAAWLLLRDAPGRTQPVGSLLTRLVANAKLPISWQACILYAVAFGGYVAFSVYLPSYLKTAYGLDAADAANRMAGFVVVAVLMRPLGGWLSDRLGPVPVLAASYSVVVAGAAVAATTPLLEHVGTVAFLAMAAALGAGSGATFALVAKVTDPSRVGGVTGLVGAAGGLGGFVPPLIMGYVYGRTDSYGIGLVLLSVTAALTLLLTLTIVRNTANRATQDALHHA
ncbi:NNP family nitrate/nitrite transporter-like MFS transporter [Kribbella orskensis]|uniref:NNP family nitrate/nitrite transporter-like MFS transporter n=1 Tax=Kribbella orskensis TaxID=2512216 RepID=A0ABY2BAK1_9ACTN|nr:MULTISPECIES: MFS transporter [Kribbella]TCN33387.1 NNP family nitrate/nitrite transporter-like MFS transporter [Kribbella sp. VKM Ac-2500]TCO13533.1 NNP family nitrate/nitrite transporter-like MFS transporter [Kribbella orskensis]